MNTASTSTRMTSATSAAPVLGGVSTVNVVGAVLPADVVGRAMAGSLPGLASSDYHLVTGERISAAAARSWEYLLGAYTAFRVAEDQVPAGQPTIELTRQKWLLVLLRELGYGQVPVTPGGHLLIGDDNDLREYPVSHMWGDVPIHLMGWRVDLDHRSEGVAGAARAPQSMVQEALNRSEANLWAILSNGRVLRLLRDSSALVGQAYVEFDLEAMFDGEMFSDFVALYLLCHQSRLERLLGKDGQPGAVTDRWLEHWRSHAIETGTRALADLRGGVEQALEALGTGFLQHPANAELRQRLSVGEITPADYQRALLRIVYRLLFWFVVEDRGLLLAPDANDVTRKRYANYFSSARLRRTAIRTTGSRHHDLWQQTTLILNALGESDGLPELGLPGLGGLFDNTTLDVLQGCDLSNTATLRAVSLLSTTTDKTGRRAVDFHHLGAEELGGIYEGLLELHPQLDPGNSTLRLQTVAGNERKTSGSYYTPADLISLVLDEALDPILDQASRTDDPEAALLAVTVCDPACGSGHFLVAAARRLAVRVAAVRSGEAEPTPAVVQAALRDVVGRCIYGVDLNPMAAELAKVSLWLEAVEAGQPLAFLDANIKVGNALLGTTPALLAGGVPDAAFKALTGDDKPTVTALRRRNKLEREQALAADVQGDMFAETDIPITNIALAEQLADISDATRTADLAEVHHAATRLATFQDSPTLRHAIDVADAWCAGFTQPKNQTTAPFAITDKVLRDWATSDPNSPQVSEQTRDLVAHEASQHRFFHWHLEFPLIFPVPESSQSGSPDEDVSSHGWTGGFTVIVGNPPWDRVKLQEKEFFADVQEIATAANAAARKMLIKALPETDPALSEAWVRASRAAEATSQFLRTSGRFPLTGRGDVNTYQVFAETMRDLVGDHGRSSLITPTELGTGKTTAPFIAETIRSKRLAAFLDFETGPEIWSGIGHNRFRFVISAFSGRSGSAVQTNLAFMLKHPRELTRERSFQLSPNDLDALNPNTGTLPVFRSRRDAEITLGIYRHHPVLIRDGDSTTGEPEANPWGLSFQRMFDMASDSSLFRTAEDLEQEGATFDGWAWTMPAPDTESIESNAAMPGATRTKVIPLPAGSEESVVLDTPRSQMADGSVEVPTEDQANPTVESSQTGSTSPSSGTDSEGSGKVWLPLYEAKLLNHYDQRFSTYRDLPPGFEGTALPRLTAAQHNDPACDPLARYWVEKAAVARAIGDRTDRDWLFGWRDIARASDVRTMVPSVLPRSAVGNKFPIAYPSDPARVPILQTAWSSLAFDYVARQKLSGTGMTYFILKQISCPTPEAFNSIPPWLSERLCDWIIPRVLELTYTSYRIAGYARDMGDIDPTTGNVHEPFRWIAERRALIRAELDAAMMYVYGLARDEVEHVLDSFPVLRKYEERTPEKSGFGEFKTRRLVLQFYDAMADASQSAIPYETPINPAPGHGPRHSPRSPSSTT